MNYSEIVPKAQREDETDYTVVKIAEMLGETRDIVKINFYSKDGDPKVFVGFSDETAIATGSAPIFNACQRIKEALGMADDETRTPEPVTVTIQERKSKSGRNYYVFE